RRLRPRRPARLTLFPYTTLFRSLNRADIDACPALRVLAESEVAGPMLLSTESGRQIFVIGHPEYDKYTLDAEYRRDVAAGRQIRDRKSTRLNSSHVSISYAICC